jgi:hypothetical protein
MHEPGIVPHAAIMSVEGEQNAVRYAKGAKYSPTVQKSDLAGRDQRIAGRANLAVVK